MKMASVVLEFHVLFSLRLLILCVRFVRMVCQSLMQGLLLRSFLAFLCAGSCLTYPIANIFEPLQIRLDFFKGNTQLCDFVHKGLSLFFEFLCCGNLSFGVLAQNSSGFAPIPELTDREKSRKLESKGAHVMEQKKTKKRTAPPRYDDAFKAGAVRLVTEQGRQPVEVAKELGICIDTLRSWLKASGIQMGQVSRQNREQKRIRELEAENRSLRRQLGEKDEVIDVLKKSVGILSKP